MNNISIKSCFEVLNRIYPTHRGEFDRSSVHSPLVHRRASIKVMPGSHRVLPMLLLLMLPPESVSTGRISIAKHRKKYEKPSSERLKYGKASEFAFRRFQSLAAVKSTFDECRSPSSFKYHEGKDTRKGIVCTTKLGGDWVLAESEQVAHSCTSEQVLRVYLNAGIQKRWNADKVSDVKFTRRVAKNGRGKYYQQDIKLLSQRVIRSKTGPMSYSQQIHVDKIGAQGYSCFVELDPNCPATVRKPFESLSVYVGLQQEGEDVRIYAAGVFEVNRRVVPNLLVFDASGIAGDMAGKGTLWLSSHFEERKNSAKTAGKRWAGSAKRFTKGPSFPPLVPDWTANAKSRLWRIRQCSQSLFGLGKMQTNLRDVASTRLGGGTRP